MSPTRSEPARGAERTDAESVRRDVSVAPRRARMAAPSGRIVGSRSSSARHRASSSGGTPSTQSLGGSGSMVFFIVSTSMLDPTKGRRPTMAS